MEEDIRLDWLEESLTFLRDVLDSPEKLAWCREFGGSVPEDFQEEVGRFLLGYRESGAEKSCHDALCSLDGKGFRLSAKEDLKYASDAELKSQLAGLMDGDSPFVLYGMSSGLLYSLFEELLSRRKKEWQEGYVCRLGEADLDDIASLGETFRPGSGETVRKAFSLQLADPKAALFGCRRENALVGLAHARIRSDYVEGARENEKGVAYLEGIYLPEDAAPALPQKLIAAVADWAKERGCRELAADCALSDTAGAALREAAGFMETARVICYIREL